VSRIGGLVLFVASLSLLVVSARAQEGTDTKSAVPNRRTLVECVGLALAHSPSIKASDAATAEATANRRSARGRFGPVVRVEANTLGWNAPFALPVDTGGPDPVPPMDRPLIPVRDAATSEISGTLIQPLLGLWTAYEAHQALSFGEDAARHQQRATRNDVALAVTEAYLQALEAERMTELARVQARTIETHVERARRFLERELLARNDLLEAEVRFAGARAQLIQAEGIARLARANLAVQIGLSSHQEVWPADLPLGASTATSSGINRTGPGTEGRPELAAARAQVEQARAGVAIAQSQMLPEVNALFQGRHVDGVYFEPVNAWFAGVELKWNIWEWGSSYYAIDAARARARQAEAGEARARQGLQLETMQAEIELDTATAQLQVARTSVAQAEQNLQIVEHRFEQQAATSTDVLDAQVLLHATRARTASAEYAVRRAHVRLRRVQGFDLVAIEGGSP